MEHPDTSVQSSCREGQDIRRQRNDGRRVSDRREGKQATRLDRAREGFTEWHEKSGCCGAQCASANATATETGAVRTSEIALGAGIGSVTKRDRDQSDLSKAKNHNRNAKA